MSRLARGSAIALGIAVVAGLGIGLLAGEQTDPPELKAARRLPSDLCKRLGDVSRLFPTRVELAQTGFDDVRCQAAVEEETQPTHSSANLQITITPYAARVGSPPEQEARKAFERKPWQPVKDLPYPTKVRRDQRDEDYWSGTVITHRADIVVQIEYTASPVDSGRAEQAILTLAANAIWEAQ